MDNVLAASINAFSQVSHQIAVPTQALQDLLDTVQELKEEIAQLRDERARDKAEFDRFKATHRTFAVQTGKDLDALFEATEKATRAPCAITKKSTAHIDELHRLMTEERSQQVSIAKGARLLGISKERLRQLKPLILADGRFEMGWSTMKGQKGAVIRIRQYLKGTKF